MRHTFLWNNQRVSSRPGCQNSIRLFVKGDPLLHLAIASVSNVTRSVSGGGGKGLQNTPESPVTLWSIEVRLWRWKIQAVSSLWCDPQQKPKRSRSSRGWAFPLAVPCVLSWLLRRSSFASSGWTFCVRSTLEAVSCHLIFFFWRPTLWWGSKSSGVLWNGFCINRTKRPWWGAALVAWVTSALESDRWLLVLLSQASAQETGRIALEGCSREISEQLGSSR